MKPDSHKPQVLLVDDDEPLLLSMYYRFSQRYDVKTASNLAEAEELVAHGRGLEFAAAIVDISLGGAESGFDLVAPLRRMSPLTEVIMYSARSDLESFRRSNMEHVRLVNKATEGSSDPSLDQVLDSAVATYLLRVAEAKTLNLAEKTGGWASSLFDLVQTSHSAEEFLLAAESSLAVVGIGNVQFWRLAQGALVRGKQVVPLPIDLVSKLTLYSQWKEGTAGPDIEAHWKRFNVVLAFGQFSQHHDHHEHRDGLFMLVRAPLETDIPAHTGKAIVDEVLLLAERIDAVQQAVESNRRTWLADATAAVVHEIKAPTQALYLHLHAMLPEATKQNPKFAGVIEQALRRIRGLNDSSIALLDLIAKDPLMACSNLTGFVEAELPLARENYPSVTITMRGGDQPLWAKTDLKYLRRIVSVLVGNACEAAKRNPDKQLVEVFFEISGEEVVLHVQDTGSGLPPAIARDLFLKSVVSQKGASNSGLGLVLAKRMSDKLGARLGVTPKSPLGGADFWVSLRQCEGPL